MSSCSFTMSSVSLPQSLYLLRSGLLVPRMQPTHKYRGLIGNTKDEDSMVGEQTLDG